MNACPTCGSLDARQVSTCEEWRRRALEAEERAVVLAIHVAVHGFEICLSGETGLHYLKCPVCKGTSKAKFRNVFDYRKICHDICCPLAAALKDAS